MKSVLSTLLIAAALSLGSGPAAAQSAIETFGTTCRAHPDFFSFAVADLDAAGAETLCSCLGTEFAGFSDADLGMLTKDLDGSATAADRTAYGDYTGLEMKARDALNVCLAPATTPATGAADMSTFDNSCTNSAMLLELVGGTPDTATPIRSAMCECLSVALAPQVTTEEAAILGQDLDGTATEQSRAAYPNYSQLANRAGAAYDSCAAGIIPPA